MPMLDVYIPEGALPADTERELLGRLTDILLRAEGADPANPQARSIAWAFVHRPAVFVAGAPAEEPRYRVVASVPEGQLDDRRREALVAEITRAILDAEKGPGAHTALDALRVWVFPQEVPEGQWGGGGHIYRLADIAGFVLGDAEAGARYAAGRLAGTAAAGRA
ncbi:4-oxalocrotonate tautomerase [Yinghuangia seranimata]|uniref:4-oxalocrotonate tautomerase n=1 Tax=Yinghuangia seranimata TaxID=408067 RepID=UPI00248B8393|nr:4-oxalocrotonate tautomerase [Yinghuangia seranimata]MDI2125643.1 4-oxalocrotonate tautomerase [Yinghuangia seranimata]